MILLTALVLQVRRQPYPLMLNQAYLSLPGTKSAMAASSSSTSTHLSSSNVQESKSKGSPLTFQKETDTFWYPEQTVDPPSCFTPGMYLHLSRRNTFSKHRHHVGLIPLIRKGLLKGHSRQLVRRAVLCYEKTIHTHREMWDAYWGCG